MLSRNGISAGQQHERNAGFRDLFCERQTIYRHVCICHARKPCRFLSMKRVTPFAICVFLAISAAPAIAANIDLSKDPLVHEGEYTVQSVAATNNTNDPINTIKVECKFFRNATLVGSGMGFVVDVLPHQTAQVKVAVSNARDADKSDCSAASVP
jgi:hypothetical protein